MITLILQSSQRPDYALKLVEEQAEMTPAKALATGQQLSVLRKQDKTILLKALSVLITQLRQSLNVGKNLDTLQIYECASLLAEKFWYLKLEELVYVFKQAKLGKYGKVYDRLDVQVISEWLTTYDTTERLAAVERQRQTQQWPEANEPLPLEAVKQCYQKLQAGQKLDFQLEAQRKQQQKQEAHQQEAGYYQFRLQYLKERQQAEQEAAHLSNQTKVHETDEPTP